VQPSSLIFLILIAIWAAYLLQHWVRRREHLATARSVDRFSDAMRVLERRSPLPELDLSAPRPRSYAISPARPSRPEVVVKRAQSPRPDVPTGPAAAVLPTRIFHILAGVSARRLRGLSLLASFSLALVVSSLAAFSVLPWWSVLVVVVLLTADVVWLRHVVVSKRAVGRTPRQAPGSAAGLARSAARHADYFEAESQPESEPQPVVEAARGGAAELAETIEPPAQVDPSGWAPVPVPPPTYTLKAKAPDPVAVPAALTDGAAAESWSLEGLVYDCELDELVERRSATGA